MRRGASAGGRRPRLLIMVKQPRPGRVKTRLGRGIGKSEATWWFRHAVARTIRALSRDPRWEAMLLVSPDAAVHARDWAALGGAGLRRLGQGGGDLGARMAKGLRDAPPGPVLLMGGDIPGVTPAHVAAAFRALEGAEALFAPADDGGFWMVGLKRGGRSAPRALFRACRWSTEHALADAEASAAPLRLVRGAVMQDVDDAADLLALRRRHRRGSPPRV